ncbi:hypothetical protein FKM82_013032 [Ascaphus truei]
MHRQSLRLVETSQQAHVFWCRTILGHSAPVRAVLCSVSNWELVDGMSSIILFTILFTGASFPRTTPFPPATFFHFGAISQ